MLTGLISLELIARINQLDIDLRAIMREHAISEEEISKEELLRIAGRLDFKARIKTEPLEEIAKRYPLPAIMIQKDGSYSVVLKVDPEQKRALIFLPIDKKAVDLSFTEVAERTNNEFIILSHKIIDTKIKFSLKWFFIEILKYRKIITEVLVGSFVVQLFGLVTPLFTQVILDKVIVHRSMMTLDVLAFAFIAVAIFEFILNLTRKYLFTHTASKIDAKLGAKIFRHLFSLPYTYFESRKVGNIISRVRELDQIREFITSKSVSVIVDLFFSLVFVLMMFAYSVPLTLVVLLFVIIIALLYLLITPEFRTRLESKFKMGAQSNSYLVESVTGIQTVKSLAIEGAMQKKWEDNLANYVKSSFQLTNMSNIFSAISNTLQKILTITILYIGVKLVIDNKLTIGQLIAFQMFANQFTSPVLRLVNLWNELQQALLGVDRLGDILNSPIELQSSNAITLPKIEGAINFENISFKYSLNGPQVLNKLSFAVKPNMRVGLVGRSGSGKSTITKLIQRLYIANEGAISIDGIDIKHMNPTWLRNNMGVVLQDNYLFSGTIRENIALPRPNAPMETIIQVAKTAGAHEFIAQLPEGYDTIVGERGSTLSGGQKQRIAIARALIIDPRILIFDEATSALDYESERIILANLDEITKGRTTFIIAHRLSTVRSCDIILAIDKGEILEAGTHTELLNKQGYYHMLHTQQEVQHA